MIVAVLCCVYSNPKLFKRSFGYAQLSVYAGYLYTLSYLYMLAERSRSQYSYIPFRIAIAMLHSMYKIQKIKGSETRSRLFLGIYWC